jgi:TonB family protein
MVVLTSVILPGGNNRVNFGHSLALLPLFDGWRSWMFRTRSLCFRLLAVFVYLLILPAVFTRTLRAQTSEKADKTSRRLVSKVDPDYPWDLKRARIGGVVRLMVVVRPAGTVDSISVIGGNPVLVETATRAVKKWKYAPAADESTVQVNVDFNPDH